MTSHNGKALRAALGAGIVAAALAVLIAPPRPARAQAGHSGTGSPPQATTPSVPMRAVFHLADGARDSVIRGLQSAHNALHALGNEPARFVIVVHGPALRWFRRTEAQHVGPVLSALLDTRRAEWRVCRATLEQNGWREDELLPAASVVPSGALEILRLEQQGFLYFRP